MAIVYKALDLQSEKTVAVKVIRTERLTSETMGRSFKRFEREARALAKLDHPNIVKVIDYGKYVGTPYLVMPYLSGGTLKQKLGKPIFWHEAVKLILPITRALGYAHQQGIVHRDVKPSNIILTTNGGLMLADFGVAKILLDDEETADLTATGIGIGTPEYMSPEQGMGRNVDHRTDIYSLGITLYEMVTGRKPYLADTPMAVLYKQMTDPLPRPGKFVPGLPVEIERILFKALAKLPTERYQSMREFEKALENQLVEQGVKSVSIPKQPRENIKPQRSCSSISLIRLALPVVLAVITISLSVLFILTRQTQSLAEASAPLSVTMILPDNSPTALQTVTLAPSSTASVTAAPILTGTSTEPAVQPAQAVPSLESLTSINEIMDAKNIAMILIPAGEFAMGRNGLTPDEYPEHIVYLDAFYLDKYEITNALYKECLDAGACTSPKSLGSETRLKYFDNPDFDNFPVIEVSWDMAQLYCEWRGGRLPTEAEWEKSARGLDDRLYPWGNEIDCGKANFSYWGYEGQCIGDTTEVGSYPDGISPFGIYDLVGNVSEWVADRYQPDYYRTSPAINPLGAETGHRVLRGGSWGRSNENNFSISNRKWSFSYYTSNSVGFRCAMTP